MRRRALLALPLLVGSAHARAAGAWIDMYPPGLLAREQPRLQSRLDQLFAILRGIIGRGGASDAATRKLAGVRILVPLSDPAGVPLNFWSEYSAVGGAVVMPVFSLVFVEEFCTAYAWLYHNGHSLETVDEYLAMLRFKRADDFSGGRYPPPMTALGVPASAIDDEVVGKLGLRFRNSAYAFIMAHELGHILAGHPSADHVPTEQSRTNEADADAFALSVFARASEIPMGAIVFFQAQAYVMPSLGEFLASGHSEADWTCEMQTRMTHPLTADRLKAMAEALRAQATRTTGAESESLRYIAVRLAMIADTLNITDLQQCMAVAAAHARPEDLLPRPDGAVGEFLGKCVRR